MKKNYVLAFIVAGLFVLAAVFSFVEGISFRGYICLLGAISFSLAGYHWRRKGQS